MPVDFQVIIGTEPSFAADDDDDEDDDDPSPSTATD